MKKTYEMPSVEIVKFQYRDQVVAASGSQECSYHWTFNDGQDGCKGTVTREFQGVN